MGEAETLETPLTRKISRFSQVLTVAILGLALLTFVLSIADFGLFATASATGVMLSRILAFGYITALYRTATVRPAAPRPGAKDPTSRPARRVASDPRSRPEEVAAVDHVVGVVAQVAAAALAPHHGRVRVGGRVRPGAG